MSVKTVVSTNKLRANAEGLYRLTLLQLQLKSLVNVLVNEYPKSGGTWLANMISGSSGMPFPQHQFPNHFPCIFHGHYVKKFRRVPTVILWRDPRDIMVSWYHHCLVPNKHNNHQKIAALREYFNFQDYADVATNLPVFIDYSFGKPRYPRFTWNNFFDTWFHDDHSLVHHTSYELLSSQPEKEVTNILSFVGGYSDSHFAAVADVVRANSFDALADRSRGVENKNDFMRKGIVGDWTSNFNEDSVEIFSRLVEGRLEEYENRFLV